jgi:hypothetical protein
MNVTDLKDVLEERSVDSADHVLHHMRLSGVRAKVVSRRRRRAATWATFAVVAIAGFTAAVVPGLRNANRPPATRTPAIHMIKGFSEYAAGARVVAAESATLPTRQITVTAPFPALGFTIFTRCTRVPDGVQLMEEITFNGRALTSGTCGGAVGPLNWTQLGVEVGKPVTLVMTITGAKQFSADSKTAVPLPDGAEFKLALGERIPFTDYPLPPRPTTLKPFEDNLPAGCTQALCPQTTIIRSDPDAVSRPRTVTLTWRTLSSIDMVSQTPGLLHVKVNGVEVTVGEWWNYENAGVGMFGDESDAWAREFGLRMKPGDRVIIEIVPEHVAGAWQVVLTPTGTTPGN